MRHVREVLRMHREACVPMREIARLTGLARSTVRDMIVTAASTPRGMWRGFSVRSKFLQRHTGHG